MGGKKSKKKPQSKKKKVTQNKAKVSSTTILIGVLLLVMVGGGAAIVLSNGSGSGSVADSSSTSSTEGAITRTSISEAVDYSTERVDMAPVDYKVDGDAVKISVADVLKHKLVRFAFQSPNVRTEDRNFAGLPELPVLAMVSPSGKLTVGIAYCEPCRSTTFHTEEDATLTCNSCGTKWDAETLEPRSGACGAYPPDEIEVEVKDGEVLIPKSTLETWQPRTET